MGRKDAEGKFLRDTCGLKLAGAGGNVVCVSADGKLLGEIVGANGMQCDPRKAWDDWRRLPIENREPGAVRFEERGPIDPKFATPTPPPGGVILKEHYRMLTFGLKGELRHVKLDDFDHAERITKFYDRNARRHIYEAAPDFVWLTEAEWRSLIPARPRKGDSVPVSPAIRERLFRYHLVPDITFGESTGWQKKQVRGGEMTATVEEATEKRVRLRLDGLARLGLDYDTAQEKSKNGGHSAHGYEPRLLGYLDYDVEKRTLERFDLVALGDFYGTLYGDNRWLHRSGRTPLGVAFALVTRDSPRADRQVPPRAIGGEYFATGK